MRLVSALLAASACSSSSCSPRVAAGDRWLWTVGALAVALQPVFAFIGGS